MNRCGTGGIPESSQDAKNFTLFEAFPYGRGGLFSFSVVRGMGLLRAAAVALWVLMCGGLGCARDPLPGLIDVLGISAATVEPFSDWSLLGRGFPPRRPAIVELSGHAFAPGRKPEAVTIRLARVSESRTRIALGLSDEELAPLLGGAAHVTFRGDIRVEFAPMRAGGPPLSDTLGNVTFDAHRRSAGGGSTADVSAFLAHVGVEVNPVLTLTSVQVGSAAEEAGLRAEDQLLELDEVRLSSVADLVPRPGQDFSVIKIGRSSDAEPLSLVVDRRGYSRGTSAWANPSLFALLAATLALLFALRPPRLLLWLLSGPGHIVRKFGKSARAGPEPRSGFAILLCGSLLLDFVVFRGASRYGFTADAALLVFLGVLLVASSILSTRSHPSDTKLARRPLSFGRRSTVCGAMIAAVFVGSGVGLAQIGGLSFLLGAGALWPLSPPPLSHNPWLLLSGLGYLVALTLGSAWIGGTRNGSGAVLGRFGIVVLVSFWTRLFLGRFAPAGSPLDLLVTGVLSACLLEVITWSSGALSAASVPRLLGLAFLALSLPGALLFALTIPLSGVRAASGLGLATTLFLAAAVGLVALVRGRSGYRVVRSVDPWI